MTCEILDTDEGRFFACWNGPKPKDKKQRCSVCKRRWATRLCDGEKAGEPVEVSHPDLGTFRDLSRTTCDAPLCDGCTAEALPLVALPSGEIHREGMDLLQHYRRRNRGPRWPDEKRQPVTPEPDTRDFCPDCVRSVTKP